MTTRDLTAEIAAKGVEKATEEPSYGADEVLDDRISS